MTVQTVSLVIPVYNEQASLPELVQRCLAACEGLGRRYEVILVDDGSADDSAPIIRAMAERYRAHVVAVLLNKNYGQHTAVLAGFAEARGDVIVTLDADLQNPPEEIRKLLSAIEAGNDIAGGVRRMRKDSLLRVCASRAMNALMRKLTNTAVTDYGCMLRAYRRTIVDAVLRCSECNTYVPALANSFTSRIAEVPVEHEERRAGDSKYGLGKLLNLYFDLLVTTTTTPLRILSQLGTVLAALGFGIAGLLLVLRLTYGSEWAAQGVFTVFAVVFLLLGIQLLGLGLVGEYVGRISRDVQGRPRYLVREIVRGTVLDSEPAVAHVAVAGASKHRSR